MADLEAAETSFMPHLLQKVRAAAILNPAHGQQPLTLILHAAMLESGFLPAVEVSTLRYVFLSPYLDSASKYPFLYPVLVRALLR